MTNDRVTFAAGLALAAVSVAATTPAGASQDAAGSKPAAKLDAAAAVPKPIASDPSVRLDFDIVYVRAPRRGDDRQIAWSDVFAPYQGEPGSDLVLLHPDGKEEVLVAAGKNSVADPVVSFDGEWVYYALYSYASPGASGLLRSESSDLYKIHIPTKRIVRLTHQESTPNTGIADPRVPAAGVYNLGPCPVAGGKVVFTSTRNGFVASKNYKGFSAYEEYARGDFKTSQLFVMDVDGRNVEEIGYMNLGSALGPVALADGRVVFSSFESQGLRDVRGWSLFTIRPDGTQWGPLFSSLALSNETARHFAAQRSDGKIVAEEYYNQQNHGFGTYYVMDAAAPPGEAYFGSAAKDDPRNLEDKYGRIPFSPRGLARLTPWAHTSNKSANRADPNDPSSPFLGKVTHPAPAPDGNLLTVWSPGPVYGIIDSGQHRFAAPAIDSGIYLVKGTGTVASPGELLLVKNDPKVDEKWPRAVVPYRRIYGIDEPAALPPVPRDGSLSRELPAATPFALFGAPSLYRRESYPRGRVAPGAVTASYPGGDDLHENLGSLTGLAGNWFGQGADAGKYNNSEIHALRILAVEPTTDPPLAGRTTRRWWSIANERLRILGEIPVRKFDGAEEPKDSDGNPDTSFLVKLPADVAWTIQTLNKEGMVLNSAQTWHMLRPGEVRNNCGGCHAHSQAPMPFETTAAAGAKYKVFDLTRQALLLTTKEKDESGRKWDADDSTGLRHEAPGKTVEFLRDVKPILERSCVACHTQSWEKPAGNLVLDDDTPIEVAAGLQMDLLVDKPPMKIPGSYVRLAADSTGKFGNVSGLGTKLYPNLWGHPQGSRYVRYMQSRRSLLAWKIFGKRMDGFRDDDFAHQAIPGDPASMVFRGKPFDPKKDGPSAPMGAIDVAFTGSAMPPPAAVAGTFVAPNGKKIRVAPLSDEDRRTIVRWIDLGCPIDLATSDAADPRAGWFADEIRPTLSLVSPRAGAQARVERIQVGMFDYGSGLDEASFRVTASVPIDGIAAGENLGNRFRRDGDTWTLDVKDLGAAATPTKSVDGVITVSVRDRAGNTTKVERAFAVGVNPAR